MPQRKTSIRPRVSEQGPSVDPAKSRQILVIDPDPQAGELIQGIFTTRGATVRTAGGFEQARRQTQRWEPDLVVVSDALSDVQLDQAVSASRELWRHAQTMVLCSKVSGAQAIAMMRLGVCDLLTRPLRKMEVAQRIELALRRQAGRGKVKRRIHRLQRICHKLQHAHDEVTQQVDILCTDLVTAYQELAAQMQQVVQTRDYVALVKQELDLEQLLRKTLEYILEKAGPTNAAIFLPASMDE
ncbi:MAG: response regulator transcription factor, partial [Phycisphaeraceae bacterium]|nr:response regulator transcription factor [Phycisphaeraceae bacterium]